MSVLNRLAHARGRRDEIPNQELARDLAARKDKAGIREVAENLGNKDKNIQADCIKVLYEIGAINPSLIAGYAEEFAKLLKIKNNRMAWGGMTALAEVARSDADAVFVHLEDLKKAMKTGSVITVDNGVKALAFTASANPKYDKAIFPYLLYHLSSCRPKDVAQHAEKTLVAVKASNKNEFIAVLEKRMEDLSGGGLSRVKKVIKQANSR
jgi:hypothetical protein